MGKKICPICGFQDNENAAYCRECGAKMTESGGDAWSDYEQKGQYSGGQDNTSQASAGSGTGRQSTQYNNYQDYTANIPYRQSADDFGSNNGANGLQIAGLVCGILAICSCCCYGVPAVILGIAGIICAAMGNKTSKNGIGTGGLVCSIIGLILGVISTIYYAMAIGQMLQTGYFNEILDMM
ncbi:DUF4190 domain-containing protein [Acetatifactor aquisgranensis]|uniref:DUF4190 domain-containing protein n=1 Tax=Acetatifactor aquisgranensis TaxID=2941233 RepID=UPI00203CEEA6|nr:DUF4190 domain-containing protein [Acetatifactor aquisgranensis]